jgi:poly(3-hydroxyalkanoate) synthetase
MTVIEMRYTYAELLGMIRAHTKCDDIAIVAIFDKRVDFEMVGDPGVMENALAHIARDMRNQATIDEWEKEASR